MIRSHLQYAVCVWNPHHQYLIEKLEKVQKRATTLVLSVKKLHYEGRLRQVPLPTLKYRRIRGDMIELYKIFAGISLYDNETTEWITGKRIKTKKTIIMIQEVVVLHYISRSRMFIMICINSVYI